MENNKTSQHKKKFKQNVLAFSPASSNGDGELSLEVYVGTCKRRACARAFCDKKKVSKISFSFVSTKKGKQKINIVSKMCRRMHLRHPPHQPSTLTRKKSIHHIVVDYAFDFDSA